MSEDGTVEGHVGRARQNRTVQAVYPEGEEGKHAVTHYRVIERLGPVTLIECKLETGSYSPNQGSYAIHWTSSIWRS